MSGDYYTLCFQNLLRRTRGNMKIFSLKYDDVFREVMDYEGIRKQLAQLIVRMSENGEAGQLERLSDAKFRNEMLQKYGLD